MMAKTLSVHRTLHIRNRHRLIRLLSLGGEAAANCLKTLKVLISSCPTNCSASLLSITVELTSSAKGCRLAAHMGGGGGASLCVRSLTNKEGLNQHRVHPPLVGSRQ
jgi:hypothetical protein